MEATRSRSLVLAGAALDTGNLGVTALGLSTVSALVRRGASVDILDHARGKATTAVRLDKSFEAKIGRQGAWYSRRIWRPESLISMRAISRSRLSPLHPRLRSWEKFDGLLDLSGGDSFADLYGERRFRAVNAPKVIASRLGLQLVLLPQTYGPFRNPKLRAEAVRSLRSATQCWARDEDSYANLQELLGSFFQPDRHRLGVDVAFALPTVKPDSHRETLAWIEDDCPTVGINVSGLLATSAPGVSGLVGQHYLDVVTEFITWLNRNDYKVLLVPHVVGQGGESDEQACLKVLAQLAQPDQERVRLLTGITHPGEAKYVISLLDWFTGARMHSTIASLSTQVPTVATAYSGKFAGVFSACGLAEAVIDLRLTSAPDLLELWQSSVDCRDETRRQLEKRVPAVVERAGSQFDDIVSAIGR